ncbi:hypothetical protein F9B85_09600 [Heliorestis acidaminivorans]|uniref:Uncharacterized protein n=1 Tax=Heliorestis acidaminivorans TaxID=553427 RepID=A0A6I0EZL6_9FIRM|nr:hypothetical protein [Heliorestis acidaminivorans]KAB2952399.1 hypothetical protein F9B85_09600 [Heliorestis acidaminivorans]
MRHKEYLSAQEKALQELDAEYLRYRKALETAFSTAETMVEKALQPLIEEIVTLRLTVEKNLPSTSKTEQEAQAEGMAKEKTLFEIGIKEITFPDVIKPVIALSKEEKQALLGQKSKRGRKKKVIDATAIEAKKEKSSRIRWGSTEEEIKKTVFEKLSNLESQGLEINVNNIKSQYASMMRYLYGNDAIFKGIPALMEEYEALKSSNSEQKRLILVKNEVNTANLDEEVSANEQVDTSDDKVHDQILREDYNEEKNTD